MRLSVRHETSYQYDSSIVYSIQHVRLTPRAYDGLAVLRWRVHAETPRELPSFVDGFGNIVHCHTTSRGHEQMTIIAEGEVETRDTQGVVTGAVETLPPSFYLRTTEYTAPDDSLAALAADVGDGPTLDWLHGLMAAVHGRVAYRIGATHSLTPAAAALAAGAGVCQDHSHIFIAAARLMGVPARYVSGYLWSGAPGDAAEASHAWAEAHVPDLGWVGFDPANQVGPTESYVRGAIGLDYWSAAPVRGTRSGLAAETMAVRVEVQQAATDQ